MTMTRFAVSLVAALVLVGRAPAARQPYSMSNSPPSTSSEPTEQALPDPTEYVFPLVPLYPAGSTYEVLADQRAVINISAEGTSNVVAWYRAKMKAFGWQEGDVRLPSDEVLLFSRDGRYVSISGHDAPHGSVIWLHMRNTAEVTEQDALTIARNTHRIEADWSATLIPDFENEQRPVWLVEARPGNVAVWVDAITAEPFRIRESEAR